MAREVKILIGAETSKYERAMRDVKMSTRRTTSAISSAWLKAAGSFYAMLKGWEMAKLGVQAEQEAASFASMAASYGASADHIIMKLKQASAGTVDTMTLVQKAGTAMMMGISPDKISKLMEIARATSRMTGQSVTKAFEDISLAVGRQSRMILDNLGIIVKAGEANEQYARELNKTAAQLTETEKKQAFLNATVAAGEDLIKRLGDQTKTTSEMFQSFEAMIKNLKVWVGQGLVFIGKWITIVFTEAGVIVNQLLEQIFSGWSHIMALLGRLPGGEALGFKQLGGWLKDLAVQFELARKEGERFRDELLNMKDTPPPTVTPTAGGEGGPEPERDDQTREMSREAARLEYLQQFREIEAQQMGEYLEKKRQMQAEAAELEKEQQMAHLEWFLAEDAWASEELLRRHRERVEKKLELDRQAAERRIQIERNQSSVISNIHTVAAQFSSKTAKAVFLVARGFEIAKATMAAFAAYNQALAHPPGPPTTIPTAHWALAAGLSNVAAIAATTYGQMKGGGSGGVSSAPGGGGSTATVPAPEPVAAADGGQRVLYINFEGDVRIEDEAYIEELAEKISDAVEDREVRLIATNAKYAEALT